MGFLGSCKIKYTHVINPVGSLRYRDFFQKGVVMGYGLPYKGSKNKIAEGIVELIPSAENFYDLFCGGCAITHRALIENRWKNYIINDLCGDMPKLFINCVNGKYHNETRWISRDDFYNTDDYYIKVVWSFGNNCRDYLYSREIEPIKKAWHYAIFFNDFEPAKKLLNIDLSPIAEIKDIKKKYLESKKLLKNIAGQQLQSLESLERLQRLQRLQSLESLERLQRLQRLQSLESLERLQSLERIKPFNKSYEEIEIKPNSIIYCDIPYQNTNKYNVGDFDFNTFYRWCGKQKELTFISSYEMPLDLFYCVWEFSHRSTMAATANNKVIEKLFIPVHQIDLYNSKKCTLF